MNNELTKYMIKDLADIVINYVDRDWKNVYNEVVNEFKSRTINSRELMERYIPNAFFIFAGIYGTKYTKIRLPVSLYNYRPPTYSNMKYRIHSEIDYMEMQNIYICKV